MFFVSPICVDNYKSIWHYPLKHEETEIQLEFGEHKGKSLPQVIFSDPDWFFWAYETRIFKGAQEDEAREIYRKATSIKIPQKGPESLVA